MTISADTHIVLDIHTPKRLATVGEGIPTVGAADCAVWANAIAAPQFTTQTIATYVRLFRALMDLAKKGGSGTLVASCAIDASESEVAFTAPGAGALGVYVGSDVYAKAQTHFFDRTFKRLCERWLELAKTGPGATPAAASIQSVGNVHTFIGRWPAGKVINITLTIIDPDAQQDQEILEVIVPTPTGDLTWAPGVVAGLVCERIDARPHIRCERVDGRLDLSPAAPANTLESTLTVL